jgi:integrase
MARAKLKVRFRKDRGLWEVDYRDGAGMRRRPVFQAEEQAHEYAAELFKTLGQTVSTTVDREIRLRDYAKQWLAIVEHEKEPKTIRTYVERLNNHVLPALGHLKLREIQRGQIKAFVASKRGDGHAKNSVRQMKAALSVMLSDAADDGIIPANPALQLGRHKANRADKLTAAERIQKVRPMNWDQRDAFLEAAKPLRRYYALFATLAKTGLRPGEAFALQPGDVDVRGRALRVERALSLGRIKPTKTYEERTVDVTPDLLQTIQRHVTWLKAEALLRGTGEPQWLFPNEDGGSMDESRVRKAFKRALKDAKLPAFRLYDLRHTYASLLLAERAPITYVAAQLGHANASTTLRYYARWIPSKGERWADLLDRVATTVKNTVTSAAEDLAEAVGSILGTKKWNQKEIGDSGAPEVPDLIGGPSRTRTLDPLIKSQLLYQLS